ncbi:MAG TPA: phosphoribosylformylglycinamidine synthase subunit PurQ [bacterium]|nr:phosphoribosylformylglycinamidine synthase subunit PurQ [bacterium]
MTIGIVVFPGSNCDADTHHALRDVLGLDARYVWHQETSLDGLDAVILPGGFSYGDYLRAGAIAATSPVMRALRGYAAAGGPVLGICNGFQTLVEMRLLPGALLLNAAGEFRCRQVRIRVERTDTPFTCAMQEGDVLCLPIAHGEGRYYVTDRELARLTLERQIAFRYCDAAGHVTPVANPNGAMDNIAGVASVSGTVLGLMPHPERASEAIVGSADGRRIFESLARWIAARPAREAVAPARPAGSAAQAGASREARS